MCWLLAKHGPTTVGLIPPKAPQSLWAPGLQESFYCVWLQYWITMDSCLVLARHWVVFKHIWIRNGLLRKFLVLPLHLVVEERVTLLWVVLCTNLISFAAVYIFACLCLVFRYQIPTIKLLAGGVLFCYCKMSFTVYLFYPSFSPLNCSSNTYFQAWESIFLFTDAEDIVSQEGGEFSPLVLNSGYYVNLDFSWAAVSSDWLYSFYLVFP